MTFGRKLSMRECGLDRGDTSRRRRFDSPPSRQQPEHFRPGESIVDQMQDAAVRVRITRPAAFTTFRMPGNR